VGYLQEGDFSTLNKRHYALSVLLSIYFARIGICKIQFVSQAREIALITGFGRLKNEKYGTVVGGYKIKYSKR